MTDHAPRRFEFGGPRDNTNRDHATIRDPRTGEVLHETYIYEPEELRIGDHLRLQTLQQTLAESNGADPEATQIFESVAEQFDIVFVTAMPREVLERIDGRSLQEISQGLAASLAVEEEPETPRPNRQARRRRAKK